MSSCFDFKTLDAPPLWVWLLLLKEVAFMLLAFKAFTGNWLGRKKK